MSKGLSKRLHRKLKRDKNIELAVKTFEEKGFRYRLCCKDNGHFHVWNSNGKLFQYWASTGTIMGRIEKGLDNLISMLNE